MKYKINFFTQNSMIKKCILIWRFKNQEIILRNKREANIQDRLIFSDLYTIIYTIALELILLWRMLFKYILEIKEGEIYQDAVFA